MAELLDGGARRRPGRLRPSRRSGRVLRWHPGRVGRGRLRGAHPDLHRRGQGDGRPGRRSDGAGRRPGRRGGRRGRRARAGRPGAPRAPRRRARGRRRVPGGAGRPWCAGSGPTWCCARTRRPSSSARTTSTTGTTGSPGSPCSTPWPRPRPCRTTSRRRARPTRWRPSCCRARSSRTCGWTSPTTVERQGRGRGLPPQPVPRRRGVGGDGRAPGRRGRRPTGRRAVRRGVPETAPRRVTRCPTGVRRRPGGRRRPSG